MKLGIGSYTFPWSVGIPGDVPGEPLGVLGLLERANHLGVRVVQFADNLPLDRLSETERNALKMESGRRGLTLEVGTRGVQIEHLRRNVDLARKVGSKLLRTIPETSDEETVADLCAITAELATAGVKLALENHERIAVADLRRMVEAVGSPWVGICLDTVNSLGMAEGPGMVVKTLAPHTVNLHIKDFTVKRVSHQLGYIVEGTPAGKGQLNVPWLLESLQAADVSTNAILELWTPRQKTLQETMALEEAWAAESIEFLRRYIPE